MQWRNQWRGFRRPSPQTPSLLSHAHYEPPLPFSAGCATDSMNQTLTITPKLKRSTLQLVFLLKYYNFSIFDIKVTRNNVPIRIQRCITTALSLKTMSRKQCRCSTKRMKSCRITFQ